MDKISGQYLNINYHENMSRKQKFYQYLKNVNLVIKIFFYCCGNNKDCLGRIYKEQYNCFSVEAVFDNLFEVVLASKVLASSTKRLKFVTMLMFIKYIQKIFQHKVSVQI